ncbi:MAG TPA: beta-ketoacyl synthase chain length factor [Steroidobacteraceae bacterium]
MTQLSAYVHGIGLLGPGLDNWASGAPILAGITPYAPRATVLPPPAALPPAERRRTGAVVRLALAIGSEAVSRAGANASELPTVFSSSSGDGSNCHEICVTLASGDRQLSPTRFHNSVHNAASGYWSIAAAATPASSVLCAFDASFGAGLLEALTQVAVDRTQVLLASYDTGYPGPLGAARPIPDAFGVAMILAPIDSTASPVAQIRATLCGDPADSMPDSQLESLRMAIPAARSLPLLRKLAREEPGRVVIDYFENQRIAIEVSAWR